MLIERVEPRWIDAFERTFQLCGVKAGETAAVLCESQSRPILVELAELALQRLGARVMTLRLPSPRLSAPVPVRSTGASDALQGLGPAIAALSRCEFIADCTVEGLLHAPELPALLQGSPDNPAKAPKILMVSNEHPEILERTVPDASLETRVRNAMRLMRGAAQMRVTSAAGTDLTIKLADARIGGGWGYTARPGSISHWPGGLVLAFPAPGTVQGTLVMAPGDVNLTFKSYVRDPVVMQIADDKVVSIEGGMDAAMMRGYWAGWEQSEGHDGCRAVSHVGFGLNPGARRDALMFYDKRDCNGTELRAFGGNFLYSTGANEVAKRYTLGHFDLPMAGCSVWLDDQQVVDAGRLVGAVA